MCIRDRGLQVDAPPQPVGVLKVRGNRFAYNINGVFTYGEAGGHQFENNRFENNLTQVGISGPGAGSANAVSYTHLDVYKRQLHCPRWPARHLGLPLAGGPQPGA